MKFCVFLVFIIQISLSSVIGYRILGIFPHTGKSHQDVFDPLLIELVGRGHNLSIVSHFPLSKDLDNYELISMKKNTGYVKEVLPFDIFEQQIFGLHKIQHLTLSGILVDLSLQMCETLTKLQRIHEMINQKEYFDVILVEQFYSDCALGVAHLLNAPIIALQSHTPMPWTYRRFGQPNFPSYMPCLYLRTGPKMNFLERVENTLMDQLHQLNYRYRVQIPENLILQRNLNRDIPDASELAQQTVAVLTNSYYVFHGVKPMVPGLIEVGGIHIKKQTNLMDSELEAYMNSSEHGVIIFSMGSMLKSSTFPADKRDAFVEAFSKIKENVIWKWEGEPIPGLSSNVKVIRWLPQMELLHHPKTVAFISHGGLLGTTEAIHAGVPTLFIPVFADQGTNSAAAVEKGIGARVLYTDVNEERITRELAKVLSPEMRLEAKKLSEQWRDRESPLKVAADTVEYVAKYGGKHFRSPAQDLYWFQIYSLDVYLFFLVIIMTILFVDYLILKWLLKLVFIKNNVKVPSEQSVQNNNNYSEKYKQQ